MEEKRRLDRLKEEYNQIPVSKEARNRILAGIEKGKKDKRQRRVVIAVKRTGLAAAAAAAVFVIGVNASPTVAAAMEKGSFLGQNAEVVALRTYRDQQDKHQANIQVPEIRTENGADLTVNKSIEEYANELIAQYEAQIQGDQEGEGHYSLDSTYSVVTDNEKYLSLKISTTAVMGSGAQYVKIFTIDKRTGEELILEDLFENPEEKFAAISDNIKEQMVAQMAADESKMYFYGTGDQLTDTFQGITGNESFCFNEQGELVIVFDEYTVAPGYMGAVEFVIPKDVTGEMK